ncbi:beta-galactosidase 16 [Quercus suber]|uniref:Beta-galactosidase 16 n=1 Tax=Quercus suber TaxID=58331 RepID=A0AAW0LLI5_QUESU
MNKVVINNPQLLRQPKWGHLKELHAAIKLCSTTLLQGVRTNFSFRLTTRGNVSKVKTVYNDKIIKSTQTFDSEEFKDVIMNFEDASFKSNELLEHTNTTKEKSDYLWYTLRIFEFMLGRIPAGAANGSSNVKYFTMDIPIELNDGMNILVSNKMMGWNQYS